MRRQVWISTVLGTQLCVVFFSLMKEHPWEEHLICSPKRGWVLLQVFMHSSMKEHPPLLAANTHCKTIDREKPHIVYVGVKHLFLWSFNFSSTRQQMKTALDRALRLLACHACVWTQRCHSEPQWANCLYLNSPPSELIAGTMNNNMNGVTRLQISSSPYSTVHYEQQQYARPNCISRSLSWGTWTSSFETQTSMRTTISESTPMIDKRKWLLKEGSTWVYFWELWYFSQKDIHLTHS